MTAPYGWGLVVTALAATGVAIWAGPNLSIAVPAAVIAVVAAALLFLEVALRSGTGRSRLSAESLPPRPAAMRTAFVSGRLGRERLVLLLDVLDRRAGVSDRGPRSPDEIDRFSLMPPEEFRAYLRGRVDDLEART